MATRSATALTTALSLLTLTLSSLPSTALAASKKKHTTKSPASKSTSHKKTVAKPTTVAKSKPATQPLIIVIPPSAKSAKPLPRPKAVAVARPPRVEDPEDENTINVHLETGDEELDYTLASNDDPISRSRAALEGGLGPRNGRYRNSSRVVARALSYRGARYRFGATGSNGAFDCSGFVQHLLRTEGVSLPRTASDQFHGGKSISKDELQAGDLVFFRNTYKHGISHVGMYVGEGMFVHAASSKRGVVVDPLDLPYYNDKFAGARRYK